MPACVDICAVIDTAVNQHRRFSHADVIGIIYLAQLLCASLCVCVCYIRYKGKLVSHSSKITATIMSLIFITVSNHLLEPENTHTHTDKVLNV